MPARPLSNRFMLRYLLLLPRARRWLARTIAEHAPGSRRLSDCGFARLSGAFSAQSLDDCRLVEVERVPQPPLEQWGIGESNGLVHAAAGITLMGLIIVRRGMERDESLVFHELVHAIQWRTLGLNRFLALYGLLLHEYGYRDSPLEEMAYDLQALFDANALPSNIEAVIAGRTQELFAGFRKRSIAHRIAFAMVW